jgi:hypothetical protein
MISHSLIFAPPQVLSHRNSAFLGMNQNPLCQGYLVDIVVIGQAQLKLQAHPYISKLIIQSSNISSNKRPSQPKITDTLLLHFHRRAKYTKTMTSESVTARLRRPFTRHDSDDDSLPSAIDEQGKFPFPPQQPSSNPNPNAS